MSSKRKQHLRIYNQRPKPDDVLFPQFPKLPNEVRQYVWDLAIPQERLLRVRLHPIEQPQKATETENAAADTSIAPGSLPTDDTHPYQIVAKGRKLVPKFLHICQEARVAALRFYRVRLPCLYSHGTATSEGTLYLNPEHDILGVDPGRREDNFVRFVRTVQEGDAKGVGFENLAGDFNEIRSICRTKLDMLEAKDRQALAKSLSRLRRVYFAYFGDVGRMFLGPLNGVLGILGFEMHRSRPVLSSTPAFDRLTVDPRPIQKDLERVFLGTPDPLEMFYNWRSLLHECGVKERADVEYRYMVSTFPRDRDITEKTSAEAWVDEEDSEWHRGLAVWEQRLAQGAVKHESQEELRNAPQTAVGFWLFPIDALGDVDSLEKPAAEVEELFRPKRVSNLAKFPPELGLSRLS